MGDSTDHAAFEQLLKEFEYRQWRIGRGMTPADSCCCRVTDDDVVEWCAIHAKLRDEAIRFRAFISDVAAISGCACGPGGKCLKCRAREIVDG